MQRALQGVDEPVLSRYAEGPTFGRSAGTSPIYDDSVSKEVISRIIGAGQLFVDQVPAELFERAAGEVVGSAAE
jgi:hypothetical protein